MPTVTRECGTDAVSKNATTPEPPFCPSGVRAAARSEASTRESNQRRGAPSDH
jgi:hypothetical protein